MIRVKAPAAWLALCLSAPALAGRIYLPLRFECNAGQAAAGVDFVARGRDYAAFLTAGGITVRTGSSVLRMSFLGANVHAEATRLEPLTARAHYLIGGPESRHTDVSTYGRVVYHGVYPGIDVAYHADASRQLEYDLVVAPGTDPSQIRLRIEGGSRLEADADGGIALRSAAGVWRHTRPAIYQFSNGIRRKIAGRILAHGQDEIAFDIPSYDRSLPLVIDPTLVYSTYLGGSGLDAATSIAVDSAGNAYVTGWTESLDFPEAAGPRLGNPAGVDVYVAKLSPAGELLYITYLGGSGDDRGYGIAVDGSGSAVVAGWTYSGNFPLANASQPILGGGRDGFVAKLSPSGATLVFSTYLGGTGADCANSVAVDPQGNIYVAGETTSSNLPTLNAFQPRYGGGDDAFVMKFSPSGARLYSTYLGGLADDRATAIAVDNSGSTYITGSTYSSNFPVLNGFQTQLKGGQDAFMAKLGPGGNALAYSTYLGGSGGAASAPETGIGIAVDTAGCAYVAGTTSSWDFPVVNPLQSSLAGSQDAFVLKLSATGGALAYSTYLGGSSIDVANAIAVDSAGKAYVAGYTASTDFPAANALKGSNAGGYDAFVVQLTAAGNALGFATYVGGNGSDSAYGVALGPSGEIYVAGQTMSTNFPVASAAQGVESAAAAGFVTKISGVNNQPPQPVSVSPSSGSGGSRNFTFSVSDSNGYSDISYVQVIFNRTLSGSGACYLDFIVAQRTVYLANDQVTSSSAGALGSNAILQNSQCQLSLAGSSASGSGNTLTFTLALTFGTAFQGQQGIYVGAANNAGLGSQWFPLGSWTVTSAALPPQPVSVSPSSGAGISQNFTFTVSDSNGYSDIGYVQLIFNRNGSGTNACYMDFIVPQRLVYLANDLPTAASSGALGSNTILQNSQCQLNLVASSASGSGNTLTFTLALTFGSTFQGQQNIYVGAATSAGLCSQWFQLGSWTVAPALPPQPVSVSPSSGTGIIQNFTFTVSDSNGYSDIGYVQVLVSRNGRGTGACFLDFFPSQRLVYLANDQLTSSSPAALGSNTILQNSQCQLNLSASSASGSSNTLTLTLALTFGSTSQGQQDIYVSAANNAGLVSQWFQLGSWTP